MKKVEQWISEDGLKKGTRDEVGYYEGLQRITKDTDKKLAKLGVEIKGISPDIGARLILIIADYNKRSRFVKESNLPIGNKPTHPLSSLDYVRLPNSAALPKATRASLKDFVSKNMDMKLKDIVSLTGNNVSLGLISIMKKEIKDKLAEVV